METEWCFLRECAEIMVNVTGIYDDDLDKVLAEIERTGYAWTGVTFDTDSTEGEVTQWMFLLGATSGSNASNSGTSSESDTERSMR